MKVTVWFIAFFYLEVNLMKSKLSDRNSLILCMFPMMGSGFGPGMVLKGFASSHPIGFSWLVGWFERISATVAYVCDGKR